MAALMPGVQSFEIAGRPALEREGEGAARPRLARACRSTSRRPRSASPSSRACSAKGNGVGAMINMQTSFTLEPADGRARACSGRPTSRSPGPVGVDGPARAAADRQAAGQPGARRARQAGAQRRRRPTRRGVRSPMAPPFRIGADAAHDGAARRDARDRAGARPRRLRHDLARRGLPVVAQARHGGALLDRASRR